REEITKLDAIRKRPATSPVDARFPLLLLVPSEQKQAPEAHLVFHEDLDTFRRERRGETFLVPAELEDSIREQLTRKTYAHTGDTNDPMEISLSVDDTGQNTQQIELRIRYDDQYRNDSWYEASAESFGPLFQRQYKVPLGVLFAAYQQAFLISLPVWMAWFVLLWIVARRREPRRVQYQRASAGADGDSTAHSGADANGDDDDPVRTVPSTGSSGAGAPIESMIHSLTATRFETRVVFTFCVILAVAPAILVMFRWATGSVERGESSIPLFLVYIPLTLFVILPSLLLFRLGQSIDRALQSEISFDSMSEIVGQQARFWRYWGRLCLLILLTIPLALVIYVIYISFPGATPESRQKRTVGHIRATAHAVESYAVERGGYPRTGNIDALAEILEPAYARKIARQDMWEQPYYYRAWNCRETLCRSYAIASGGKGGEFVYPSLGFYNNARIFADDETTDIILRNGEFISGPREVRSDTLP
ncbi:MAG: hypothetical protein KY432_09520, partial [Acidobacteria bacterium]|nr:hypothetical protein [Acidobacteriota bacterium]